MHYVYLIQNSDSGEKYIGCTKDLKKRMNEHNSQLNISTVRNNGIWELIYYEAYLIIDDAFEREKRLKQHGRAKQELYKRCNHSLSSTTLIL